MSPSIILIVASWCGPCVEPAIVARSEGFRVVDLQEVNPLAFPQVRGIPAILRRDGEVLATGTEQVIQYMRKNSSNKEGN